SLTRLPAGLRVAGTARETNHGILASRRPRWSRTAHVALDLQGCAQVTGLPGDLVVQGAIEIAGTGLTGGPPEMAKGSLSWNAVTVPPRVVFEPESFTARELLEYPNLEVRRVVMERLGADRLVDLLQPTTIDEDHDPGGPRRLVSVDIAS